MDEVTTKGIDLLLGRLRKQLERQLAQVDSTKRQIQSLEAVIDPFGEKGKAKK